MPVVFRPHHFLCTFCFQGRGYSPAFVENFQTIVDTLSSPNGDATPIQITAHTDSICDPCPNKRGQACTTQTKITTLDQAHAQALNIQPGQTISWGDAKAKITAQITPAIFDRICSGCEWKDYGICENVLKTIWLK